MIKNPFPGLRPYQSDEYHLFFGRKKHVDTIVSKLEKYRFVSVVGNSGSGKSSLVRAGILPAIQAADKNWMIVTLRPGQNPVEELYDAVKQILPQDFNKKEILDILLKSDRGLIQWLRTAWPEGKRVLILVDQFEELFRFSQTAEDQSYRDLAQRFVQMLLRAIEQKELPIYMLMTIRSDFLGECERFDGLPEAINDGQFLIPRMNRNELMECVNGPVEVVGGKISPRLVNFLLDRTSNNPDQLPVLQHVLMRSWEEWEKDNDTAQPIDLKHYELTGGMEMALSNHAEEAFSEIIQMGLENVAERMFKAITMKGTDNRGVRRPTTVAALADICETTPKNIMKVADVFRRTDRGLLMPPETKKLDEATFIDISHESLMRIWERLRDWVDEEGESAELYQRISESAVLYLQNKSGLWTDPDLQIAVDWRDKQHPNAFWAAQYNDEFDRSMQFIAASEENKRFMLADKKRRNRILMVSLVVVLAVLSVLTLWAFRERSHSQKNARMAIEEQKKAEAQKQIAEKNALKAEEESKNAQTQKEIAESRKNEAEKQRLMAEQNEKEARLQKLLAEKATLAANDARKRAELDKQIAVLQKQISDSLKVVAEISEKQIYRSRILSLAQNMAIKSANATPLTYAESVKSLLALQAANFNRKYQVKDKDTRLALIEAYQSGLSRNEKSHNGHEGSITGLSVNKDGWVASCGEDGSVILCQPEKPSTLTRFPKQPFIFKHISWNKDGTLIACVADNRSIYIFDARDVAAKPTIINPVHTDQITGLGWNSDKIITVGVDKKLTYYNAQTYKVDKQIDLPERPSSLSLNGTGTILAIGFENGLIQLMDVASSQMKQSFPLNGRIQAVCFMQDNQHLAAGNISGQIFLLGAAQPIVIKGHKSGISALDYSTEDGSLVSSAFDGMVKIWNPAHIDEEPIVFAESEGSWLYAAAFTKQSKYLVAGGKDKTLRSYLCREDELYQQLSQRTTRNFTKEEWIQFVGTDIPWEKTIPSK